MQELTNTQTNTQTTHDIKLHYNTRQRWYSYYIGSEQRIKQIPICVTKEKQSEMDDLLYKIVEREIEIAEKKETQK